MYDFYFTILLVAINIAAPYAITRVDRGRLPADRLARAWNTPSWACAVYFFGPLCLPAHFWITRRTLLGLLAGIAWMCAVFALESGIGYAMEDEIARSFHPSAAP